MIERAGVSRYPLLGSGFGDNSCCSNVMLFSCRRSANPVTLASSRGRVVSG